MVITQCTNTLASVETTRYLDLLYKFVQLSGLDRWTSLLLYLHCFGKPPRRHPTPSCPQLRDATDSMPLHGTWPLWPSGPDNQTQLPPILPLQMCLLLLNWQMLGSSRQSLLMNLLLVPNRVYSRGLKVWPYFGAFQSLKLSSDTAAGDSRSLEFPSSVFKSPLAFQAWRHNLPHFGSATVSRTNSLLSAPFCLRRTRLRHAIRAALLT